MRDHPDESAEAHALQCMELWGGAGRVDHHASVAGLDVHVIGVPHKGGSGGGDLHYVTTCGAQNITRLALADVAGHGEGVAEFSSILRRFLRKHINTVDQSSLMRALNHEMSKDERSTRFATAVLATYYAPTDHLIVTNAGHPPPMWYRKSVGSWFELTSDTARAQSIAATARDVGLRNLPLGIIDKTEYEQFAIPLEPEDLVLFYTDAVIEAAAPNGGMLGTQGLVDLLNGSGPNGNGNGIGIGGETPETLLESLTERLLALGGGTGQLDDDLTLMLVHHNASDPPPQSMREKVGVLGRMMGIGQLDTVVGV